MAEAAALTIEDARKRLIQIRYHALRGEDRKLDDEITAWLEELSQARPCVLCKGPVAKRLVPAKATLDYDKPPA